MRKTWLIYGVVIIVIIGLGLPALSYSKSGSQSTMKIDVSAELESGQSEATYSISSSTGGGYLGYVSDWWGNIISPTHNPSPGPEIYPLVVVKLEPNWGQGFNSNGLPKQPAIQTMMYTYTLSESWHCQYIIENVPANGHVKVTVLIYSSPEITDGGLVKTL